MASAKNRAQMNFLIGEMDLRFDIGPFTLTEASTAKLAIFPIPANSSAKKKLAFALLNTT